MLQDIGVRPVSPFVRVINLAVQEMLNPLAPEFPFKF